MNTASERDHRGRGLSCQGHRTVQFQRGKLMKKITVVAMATVAFTVPASAQSLSDVIRTVSRVAQGGASPPQGARMSVGTDREAPLDPRIASGRVAGFNLAGIRLGMTPKQAVAQGSLAGFRNDSTSNGASFAAQRLTALRARRPNFPGASADKVVREQHFVGQQGDRMLIAYAAMPDGPRVEKVSYFFDPKKIDQRDLEQTMFKKFGSPNGRATMVGDSKWCDHQCRNNEADAGYANSPFNIVSINGSQPAQNYISGLINADVERLTPKGRSGI